MIKMKKTIPRFFIFPVLVVRWVVFFLFIMTTNAQDIIAQLRMTSEKVESIVFQPATEEEPLSLKACLAKALNNNPLLSEAGLSVKAFKKGVDSAMGKHFPKIALDLNYTRRQDPLPFIPAQSTSISPHFSNEFASLNVLMTLPIYQGGQITNGIELVKIRKIMQEENLTLTRNEIIANTVNTYNKIQQLKKIREAAQASLTALENQQKNSQMLFDLGRIAKVDLLKVAVQLANERQRFFFFFEGLTNLAGTLHYLMGEQVEKIIAVPVLSDELTITEFTPNFDQSLLTAQKKRPEYLIVEAVIQEAEINTKITQGRLLPSINAFAGYMDQYGYNPYYNEANWYTGINLSLPLFEKSLYDEIAKEHILKEKAEKHRLVILNQIRLDIQNALSSLKESKNRILTAKQAVKQAEESFRIEQKKYSSGAGIILDFLFAQAAYITAVANHSQALFDYNAAMISYRKVTGTLEDYLQ